MVKSGLGTPAYYGLLHPTTAIRIAQKASSMVKNATNYARKDFFGSPRGEFTGNKGHSRSEINKMACNFDYKARL